MPTRYQLELRAPVPVGHAAVLEFYNRRVGFSGMPVQRDQPIVVDVVTGMHWGRDWHHESDLETSCFHPTRNNEIELAHRVEGVVGECHVIGSVGPEDARIHAILVLDPPATSKGYR